MNENRIRIETDRGFVSYARFCGGALEAWSCSKIPVAWLERDANRIIKTLKKLGIRLRRIAA